MRRIIALLSIVIIAVTCFSQVNVTQGAFVDVTPEYSAGADKVFLVADINAAELTTTVTNPQWYLYPETEETASPVSNQAVIYPEQGTYLLRYKLPETQRDTQFVVAVIAYTPSQLESMSVSVTQPDECSKLQLHVEGSVDDYNYQKISHEGTAAGMGTITRQYTVGYNTLAFVNGQWQDSVATQELDYVDTEFFVDAPLRDTEFWLVGDQYAEQLGVDKDSIVTEEYNAIAVDFSPQMVVTRRDARNEKLSPDSMTVTTAASGPAEIEFRANPTPKALYYDWQIFYRESSNDSTLLAQRSDENHRYTFSRAENETPGRYYIYASVSNDVCNSDTKVLSVVIGTSDLQVPNVFTPNGDGQNDEFRIAYQSLTEFQCVIFNRWGRKIYQWSDPTKGWDGTINGKDAAPGTYFYIIKARGTDGKKYKKAGDINLIGR
ncbi:MAG TPA: hypothetical protein DEO38_03945 [Bacteroidales bacterium]|nr:hypothetical protein [Bacteroidales bacterium]